MSYLDDFNDLHYSGDECTAYPVKIYLDLKDNDYFDFSGIDDECIFDNYFEDILTDYIYRETEDLTQSNIMDIIGRRTYSDTMAIFMLIDTLDGEFSFIRSHDQLIKTARFSFLQEKLKDGIFEFKLEIEEQLGNTFNKLITLWRKRRDRKRKEIVDSLKIHSVQDVVIGYL